MELTQELLIQSLKDYFNKLPEYSGVILYGSFAKNKFRPDSDIDIGVYCEEDFTAEKKMKLIEDFALLFHRTTDVTNLKKMYVPLSQEILTQGVWIKLDSTDIRYKLIKKMHADVADFLPAKQKIQMSKILNTLNKFKKKKN